MSFLFTLKNQDFVDMRELIELIEGNNFLELCLWRHGPTLPDIHIFPHTRRQFPFDCFNSSFFDSGESFDELAGDILSNCGNTGLLIAWRVRKSFRSRWVILVSRTWW